MTIHRGGEEIYSPPANLQFKANDVLTIVGTAPSRENFKKIIKQITLGQKLV
jgi:uncharacterized protein with PhoU and TrkA domain